MSQFETATASDPADGSMKPTCDSFTEVELDAIKAVKRSLEEKSVEVSEKELILCTLNAKLNVEKATTKYMKWLESMKPFGFTSFQQIWKDANFEALSKRFETYAVTGLDSEGRSIMWIRGGSIKIEEEADAIRAGCIFFAAIHSDFVSLRNGITFVIDTSTNAMTETVGNEQKMQQTYQSMPLRPQKIFILGAGWLKRLVINALISFASLFTSEKVIERIRFAELDEVKETVPLASLPRYVGGDGGGKAEDMASWVKSRIESFPACNFGTKVELDNNTSL